jgi:hypothetical protein
MIPVDVQLVEENLPCISNEEQMPEHCEIRSIEAVNVSRDESFDEPLTRNLEKNPISLRINSMEIDTQDSYSAEIQAVSKKSKNSDHQGGQNVEKVRFIKKIK